MVDTKAGRPDGLPADFLWGCSTSSYQIEGCVSEGGRGESIWDRFSHTPGRVANGDTGDVACGSYRRYGDDIRLLSELGVEAYRFSVAWPRVQPSGRGAANAAGLDYYSRLVDGLLEAGIEPWAALYHWDLPQALEDAGGWRSRETSKRFADYADIVFRALGDRVSHWATLNEPWCSAYLGHLTGEHAPGLRNPEYAYRAVHHLLLAHGLAARVKRTTGVRGEIGLVINPATPSPATDRSEDEAAALRASVERTGLWLDPVFGRGYPAEYFAARGFDMPVEDGDLEAIAEPLDYIGVNYYNEDRVEAAPTSADNPDGCRYVPTDIEKTAMGWDIVPAGLTRLLSFMAKNWPIKALYVTENGAAFDDAPDGEGRIRDERRVAYFRDHLAACRDAVAAGVPLKGYFAWTLLDNFEWAWGYGKRFGLAAVDPGSLERRPKDSFYYYRDVIAGKPI